MPVTAKDVIGALESATVAERCRIVALLFGWETPRQDPPTPDFTAMTWPCGPSSVSIATIPAATYTTICGSPAPDVAANPDILAFTPR